ncbi:hypothetical protein C2E23DRAFT_885207 [Lenzites betulinus]|nr:hypothetical protein C2E23DRAFT_885207 [Lenzites betulinus]
MLRTYVLSGRNKLLGGVALILSLGPLLVDVSTFYLTLPVNLPPPENCAGQNAASTAEAIGCERNAIITRIEAQYLITIVVTWRATRTSRKVLQDTFKQPSLQDIMWTNGNIYFITLLFGNLLDLILVTLSITDPKSDENWVVNFLDAMTMILSCRFLLDLYETNARLERGGSSLSQSNIGIGSLHFTGIGGPEGDSPEDSPFLSSFSGPVLHSFPDDSDMVFDTTDDEPETGPSVPARTTALAAAVTETAAEGSSCAWTADTAVCSAVAGRSGFAGGSEMAV